jgi:ribosomal protein L14E/L6E/L27E
MLPELIGRVVVSAAGRDRGRRFAIVAILDDAHVALADGSTHRYEHPKRKKLRHMAFTQETVDGAELLRHAKNGTADAFLRKSLSGESKGI